MQLKSFQSELVEQIGHLPRFVTPYVYRHVVVPTGGGKTVILVNSIPAVMDEEPRGAVVIITPSDTITEQILHRLQSAHHPYRLALNAAFGGPDAIRVLSIPQAMSMERNLVSNHLVILVTNVQALKNNRREEQNRWRLKVQRPNSNFGGRSLVDVLRETRPYVILDESHKGTTPLTDQLVDSLNPRLVIGFTATPPVGVPLLGEPVSGTTLRDENLIRLPLELHNRPTWTAALEAAVAKRSQLEDLAVATAGGGYVRPVLLIQAEQEKESNDRITVDEVKLYLTEHCEIDPSQIRIATGTRKELETSDALLDSSSLVRFIITVDALKEGWDLGFAQVLCSFKNYKSDTATTQIMGRIMRMYGGRPHSEEALNRAYIYTSSPEFVQTATAIAKTLQGMYGVPLTPDPPPPDRGDEGDGSSDPDDPDPEPPSIVIHQDLAPRITASDSLRVPVWRPGVLAIEYSSIIDEMVKRLRTVTMDEGSVRREIDIQDAEGSVLVSAGTAQKEISETTFDFALFVRRVALYSPYLSVQDLARESSRIMGTQSDTGLAIRIACGAIDQAVHAARAGAIEAGEVGGLWTPPSQAVVDWRNKDSRCIYGFRQLGMNKEEAEFIEHLTVSADSTPRSYVRNHPGKTGYAIPMPDGDHYPDFIIWSVDGNDVEAVEYKGQHLLGSVDTRHKQDAGRRWAELCSASSDMTVRYSMWTKSSEGSFIQI